MKKTTLSVLCLSIVAGVFAKTDLDGIYAGIEARVTAADRETDALQKKLTDRCRLTDYAAFFHTSGFAVQAGDGDAHRYENITFDNCFADGLHLNGNRNDGEPDCEIFDPYVDCVVDEVHLDDIRMHGTPPKELVHAVVFDDINKDGASSGKGIIRKIIHTPSV